MLLQAAFSRVARHGQSLLFPDARASCPSDVRRPPSPWEKSRFIPPLVWAARPFRSPLIQDVVSRVVRQRCFAWARHSIQLPFLSSSSPS